MIRPGQTYKLKGDAATVQVRAVSSLASVASSAFDYEDDYLAAVSDPGLKVRYVKLRTLDRRWFHFSATVSDLVVYVRQSSGLLCCRTKLFLEMIELEDFND